MSAPAVIPTAVYVAPVERFCRFSIHTFFNPHYLDSPGMLFPITFLAYLLPNLLLIDAVPHSRGSSPTATVGRTKVTGTTGSSTNIDFFGGIPFASAPVGSLRFQPPVLQTSIPGNVATFSAKSFGNACYQLNTTDAAPITMPMSEDCLTVNIFRPAGTSAYSKLPVMFWTYGGGFHSGASSSFDASTLVAYSVSRGTPVVYVSTNYRLGPLGFPQGNEADATSGVNLGIKDLLAALKWVQANIQAFGGDPTKVTMFGQSAGAIMSSILFLNSQVSGLVRAAILSSGSAATSPAFTAPQQESLWESFVAGVPSCAPMATSGSTLGCMKNASVTDLMASCAAVGTTGWMPVIDGSGGVFPAIPSTLFAQGKYSKIPLISGDVLDEGTHFVTQVAGLDYSSAFIKKQITAVYSPPLVTAAELSSKIDELLTLYPDDPALGSPYNTSNETFGLNSGWKRATSITGDLGFQSTRRMWLQAAAAGGSKVYGYLLTQPQLGDASLGVDHTSTKKYIYGDLLSDGVASDAVLSNMIMDYWISFASCMDPNDGKGTKRPTWGQYKPSNNALMQLNGSNSTMIEDNFRSEGIAAINAEPLVFFH
ncbi:extracellular triacylglycerol lipase precursor [Mycena vulgaris]|nr:extracellular triacylglycerol lipase precursor [Mycena vulgaris]